MFLYWGVLPWTITIINLQNLQQFLEQNFECERFRPTLDTIPSNMLDTVVGLAVPTPQEGYKITPDIEPCEVSTYNNVSVC